MDGAAIPFLQDQSPPRGAADPPAPSRWNAEVTAERAREMALEVDRKLAETQPPPPRLGPVRGVAREPVLAGSVRLPYYAALHDPARITGSRHRELKDFKPRLVECVACEYRKLENRMGDPAAHGLDRAKLTRAQLQHFGPGERSYTVCKACYDTNGKIHPRLYAVFADARMEEDRQRTFRHDPAFAEIAERVAEVDRWRRGVGGEDLSGALTQSQVVEDGRTAGVEEDGEYDGFQIEERGTRLSDFTGQTPGEGRSRFGRPDPEFVNHDAHYDPERVGADEASAYLDDEAWNARRKQNFRAAWDRAGEIEDGELRRQTRARLVERWDPRMGLVGEDRMVEVNLFAEPHPRPGPYSRTATHSGVDEGFAGEPEWKKSALARHEAAVDRFLAEVRGKLAGQGVPAEKIQELTSLPDLNPGSEIGKFIPETPLHERIAAAGEPRVPALPTAAELDAVVQEGALRRSVLDDVNHIGNLEAARGRVDAESFLALARRVQQRDELQERVREADQARDTAQRWSDAMDRSNQEVRGATDRFAREIRSAFRDPVAFQAAFTQLDEEQKRQALRVLRERPGAFAREFATLAGRDFGSAGELATGRGPTGPVSEIEAAGVRTASAGEEYLNAARARARTTEHVGRHLGLAPGASPQEVADACAARLSAARVQKATAIHTRDALGTVPSPKELERAFTGLHQRDRRVVLREFPGVTSLMDARVRQLSRSGPSL